MYNWLVLLHIFFAFLFLLGHRPHVVAMLKFRGEPDPERSLTFFSNVPDIKYVRYLYMAMGVFGFAAAFITPWWKQGWTWTSAVVFAIVSRVMFKYGAGYIVSSSTTPIVSSKRKRRTPTCPPPKKNSITRGMRQMQ